MVSFHEGVTQQSEYISHWSMRNTFETTPTVRLLFIRDVKTDQARTQLPCAQYIYYCIVSASVFEKFDKIAVFGSREFQFKNIRDRSEVWLKSRENRSRKTPSAI